MDKLAGHNGSTWCSAINCRKNKRDNPELSFFRFPPNNARSQKWLKNTKRQDLFDKTVKYLSVNCHICTLHFKEDVFTDITKKNRLLTNAVPTIFDIPNLPPATGTNRRRKLTQKTFSDDSKVNDKFPIINGNGIANQLNSNSISSLDIDHSISNMSSQTCDDLSSETPVREIIPERSKLMEIECCIPENSVFSTEMGAERVKTEPDFEECDIKIETYEECIVEENTCTSNIVYCNVEEALNVPIKIETCEEHQVEETTCTSHASNWNVEDPLNFPINIATSEKGQVEESTCTSNDHCNVEELLGIPVQPVEEDMMSPVEESYSDKLCKFQAQTEDQQLYKQSHTAKYTSCEFCSFTSQRKLCLRKHILTHVGVKQFILCDLCPYKPSLKSALKEHILLHTTIERCFCCELCSYRARKRKCLRRHMLIHTREKPFPCVICPYKANEMSSLKRHILGHVEEKHFSRVEEKHFVCELCPFKSCRKSSLTKHMSTHTERENSFSCDLCSFTSSRKPSLRYHMLSHTDEKDLSCTFCSYKAKDMSNLEHHLLTHTGKKPFLCAVCPFRTARRSALMGHMLTHTVEKPFSCVLCSYKTRTTESLKKHIWTHTVEKPLSCNLCLYKTRQMNSLKRHILTHKEA